MFSAGDTHNKALFGVVCSIGTERKDTRRIDSWGGVCYSEVRMCFVFSNVDDDHLNFADVTRVLFRIICFSICLIWKVGLGDVRKTQLRQLASSCVQSMNLQQYEWSLKG